LFCCIGVYSLNREVMDIVVLTVLALLGYTLVKFDFEPAPLTLGFVLGKMMEESLRQALIISGGKPMTFIERPISAFLLMVAVIMLAVAILPKIREGREVAFVE
ncbi:MAG TPA: tripartite tricarboxylate transporter permease, partial [Beijerinckiaceae bacterium]|nr:tripartite tricarboxylate transporter permease [Beijerinckiaceae bacterium]